MHAAFHIACTDGTHPAAIALAGGVIGLCFGAAAVLIAWAHDWRRAGYLARMQRAAGRLRATIGLARMRAALGSRPLRDRQAWEAIRRRRRGRGE